MLARPALVTTPCFAFDAAMMGTGKILVAQATHAIATGRHMPVTVYPADEKTGDDEIRKILTSALQRTCGFICWDNVREGRAFGGDTIAACLTSGSFMGRILGRSDGDATPEVEWRGVMFVTGNNIMVDSHLMRRTLRSRQISKYEQATDRPDSDFRYPERRGKLTEWIREHRSELVRAALVILRAFVCAGRPRLVRPIDSFDGWTDLIASAIAWCGDVDVTRCLAVGDEENVPEKDLAYRTILRCWNDAVAGADGATIGSVLGTLYTKDRLDVARQGGTPAPDSFDALRAALEAIGMPRGPGMKPDALTIGRVFRAWRDRPGKVPCAGGSVVMHKLAPAGSTGGSTRWHVVPVAGG
jgi:hypothetical protein